MRWGRGAQGADYIVIADTGSTDRTVNIAASSGHDPHPTQSQNAAFAQTGL